MPRMKWTAIGIPSKCVAIDGRRTQWAYDGVTGLVLDCLSNGGRIWRYRYRTWIGGKRVERSYTLGKLNPESSRALGYLNQDMDETAGAGHIRSCSIPTGRISLQPDALSHIIDFGYAVKGIGLDGKTPYDLEWKLMRAVSTRRFLEVNCIGNRYLRTLSRRRVIGNVPSSQ